MAHSSKNKYRITELDPKLISSSFEVRTKWHVITGAPSCGKTTLIHMLQDEGYRTVPETARQYMEGEISRGRTIDEIHESGANLQQAIIKLQIRIEHALEADATAFLDGSVPGSLSWYRVFGLNPNDILSACFIHRYASVFVLDRLPLQQDGLRFKDDFHAAFLDEWIFRDHRALGYDVVRVPVLAPKERLAFVLERISEQDSAF